MPEVAEYTVPNKHGTSKEGSFTGYGPLSRAASQVPCEFGVAYALFLSLLCVARWGFRVCFSSTVAGDLHSSTGV